MRSTTAMHSVPRRQTFKIAGSFDPTHSLLGRVIGSHIADRRQASTVFILVAATIAAVVAVGFYALWAWLHPAVVADPSGTVALSVWAAQVLIPIGFVSTSFIGFSPTTVAEIGLTTRIRKGDVEFAAPFRDLRVREISVALYYRHYRRYARTRSFVGRLTEDKLLLIETRSGDPVVLELDANGRETFIDAHTARPRAPRRGVLVPLLVEAV